MKAKKAQIGSATLLIAFLVLSVGVLIFSDFGGITGFATINGTNLTINQTIDVNLTNTTINETETINATINETIEIVNETIEESIIEALEEEPDEPLPVIIELKNQRAHKVSKEVKQKHKPELEQLASQASEIRKKIKPLDRKKARSMTIKQMKEREDSFLTKQDKKQLRAIANNIDANRDKTKREIYSELKTLVEDEQADVKSLIEECGGTVHGGTALTNSLFARIPPSCLEALKENDLVAGVHENKLMKITLDDSMCTTGAPTWHNNGYDGGTWDIAVVDTGVDSSHPALSVAAASTFHTYAQFVGNYNDNPASTDDLHGHGTHVAGIIASTDSTYTGVANGTDGLINAKAGWLASPSGGYMYWSDMMDAVDWAIITAGADVISLSFGSSYSAVDDCQACRYADAVVDDLGVSFAISAGNDGPTVPSIGQPAIAYNIFSVANVQDAFNCDRSDDTIRLGSSRGPTYGGRVKPDIAAPGTSIMSANDNWEGIGFDFVSMTGTSMAAPHVAAAALLVLDYKASSWDPKAVKALLLNTADNDGSFSIKNDFGWGYMNLTNAYIYKDNVVIGEVNESNVEIDYKYYNVSLDEGGKATMVWNRHVVYAGSSFPGTYYTLNNIDLYLYNESDGNLISSSTSSVENVEQVVTQNPITGVIKVQAVTSNFQPTSSNSDEFGLAAEGSIQALTGPSLVIQQNLTSSITDDLNFTISVNISNIGDLNAHNIQAGLVLPAGLTIVDGSNPRSIATIHNKNQSIINWTIKPSNLGTYNNIYSNFTSSSYDETLNGSTPFDSITVNDDDSIAPTFVEWNFTNSTTFSESNNINVTLTDASGVSSAVLYYDFGNDSSIDGTAIMSNLVGDIWNATISAPGPSYEGLYVGFFVQATDNDNDRADDQLAVNSSIQAYILENAAPNITSYYPPTMNFSIVEPNNQTFNITYEDAGTVTISWYRNGTLVSNSNNYTFYGNYSSAGSYNITVIVDDGELTDYQEWKMDVNNTNRLPQAQNIDLTSTDSLNRTNGDLTATWVFYDVDGETQQANQTKWYSNNIEDSSLANQVLIGSGNTSKNQDWLFSVRVYDGIDWGNWTNSSILTIKNTEPTAPTIDLLPDTPSGTDDLVCNITVNSTDADNDAIQYHYLWYKNSILNRTILTAQTYDILGSGNISVLEEWNCTVVPYDGEVNGTPVSDKVTPNNAPQAVNVTLNSTDALNRTTATLQGSWTFSDADGQTEQSNQTKWYNNSVEVVSLANSASAGSSYTRRNQVWLFSVRVYDGYEWSSWVNSSNITIQNAAPVLQEILDITATELDLINITATVVDEDALTYTINDSRFTKTDNHFTWLTTLADSGTYIVRINVSDGIAYDYQDVRVTVGNLADFDNDGNPDYNDTDDDNDGINDSLDRLTGDVSDISSTVSLKFMINGSENTSKVFNGTLSINVTDNKNNSILEFDWNFDSQKLALNWTIDYDYINDTLRIAGLGLTGQGTTKTVYINQSDSAFNHVCVADVADPPLTLPADCSGYTRVRCPGNSGDYSCADLGDTFKITGLDHSTVRAIAYEYTEDSDDGDSGDGGGSSGGGGGGGYAGSTTKKTIIRTDLIANEIYRIELDLANLALTHNYFSVNRDIPMVKITMELVDEASLHLPVKNNYQYFRIVLSGMTSKDLKNAELEFRVDKNWLNVMGYDENRVVLSVYDDGWEQLPTRRSGAINDHIYYVSNVGKSGYFAITSSPIITQVERPSEIIEVPEVVEEAELIEEETSWRDWVPVIVLSRHRFTVLIVIISLIVVGVIAYFVVSKIKHPYPKLSSFVKHALAKEKTKRQIRKDLVTAGWPENVVDSELKKFKIQ